MKLSEMKAIAAKRTRLQWIPNGDSVMNADCYPVADCNGDTEDAAFIALAANTFDKLLAIAEAAKHFSELQLISDVNNIPYLDFNERFTAMVLALAALENL